MHPFFYWPVWRTWHAWGGNDGGVHQEADDGPGMAESLRDEPGQEPLPPPHHQSLPYYPRWVLLIIFTPINKAVKALVLLMWCIQDCLRGGGGEGTAALTSKEKKGEGPPSSWIQGGQKGQSPLRGGGGITSPHSKYHEVLTFKGGGGVGMVPRFANRNDILCGYVSWFQKFFVTCLTTLHSLFMLSNTKRWVSLSSFKILRTVLIDPTFFPTSKSLR